MLRAGHACAPAKRRERERRDGRGARDERERSARSGVCAGGGARSLAPAVLLLISTAAGLVLCLRSGVFQRHGLRRPAGA